MRRNQRVSWAGRAVALSAWVVVVGAWTGCQRASADDVEGLSQADGAAPIPAAPAQQWRGAYCQSDADCAWNDECMPTACVDADDVGPSVRCAESAPPQGDCICLEDMCTLRPHPGQRRVSLDSGCTSDDQCAVDVPTATCHLGGDTLIGPISEQGPICLCEESADSGGGLCVFEWVGPVACQTFRDCWYERRPRLRPVPATTPRDRPVEPCVDGEVDSVCGGAEDGEGVCRVVSWGC
jgi:hypothetical protein